MNIHSVKSTYSFDETRERIADTLKENNFKVFESINHAAGAQNAGLSLQPSTLFIFGNPKGGTPLMNVDPRMGIVLPLKMHVYQAGDDVYISYTDIQAAAQSFGLAPDFGPLPKVSAKLDEMATKIAG